MRKHRWKGGLVASGLAALCAAAMVLPAQPVSAAEENLALNKPVTASAEGTPAGRLTDGNKDKKAGRWSAEQKPTQWAYVDLGASQEMNYFELTWESNTEYATDFNIYVSDSKDDWGEPDKAVKGNTSGVSAIKLDAPVTGQYVKLEVTKVSAYPNVSCSELEIKNISGEAPEPKPQDPTANIAQGVKVETSSNEADSLNGSKVVDGDTTDRNSRWSTGVGAKPASIMLDFGVERDVKTFRVFWENRKATNVKFQIANGEAKPENNPTSDAGWTTVKTTERPAGTTQTVTLDAPVKARYARIVVNWEANDPDGGVTWDTVSMYEVQVYGGEPVRSLADYLNDIEVKPVTAESTELEYTLPTDLPAGYKIKYNGTDYEQVIGLDGKIYRPISDVTVKASFKIENEKDRSDYAFKEFDVTVPGTMTAGANAAPRVLPELREWAGGEGQFAASAAKRVVYGHDSLKAMAEDFAADFQAITGVKLSVASGSSAAAGDIFFTLGADAAKGLGDEGYLLDAKADRITVSAEEVAGANWGGKTILQGMKTGANNFPVGMSRDYPLYKVRGLILDVGRKTFTLDWLKQMTKQLSFYKMNDFQIHLNDNLIPLERYTNRGEDVFNAYSAFRLESDVKKGGNGGKNQADLTATDVWYSKKDFKEYIEQSAAMGVKIVPEIDTPAHSLALTKVRPDLRHGKSGRQNDHLDLKNQYGECLSFVQGIFDEYVKGGANAVFASTDTIHIGADEYNADGNAYRNFVNDMFEYAESNGKTARVWGSLSTIKGDIEVKGVSEDGKHRREMNLWNPGWADMKAMYELGFNLIDCQDGVFYIVPNAGYYYDYLNPGSAYGDPLNGISGVQIPAGDPQMIGGAFAVWNDMCDELDNGISEYDIYDRIMYSAGLFGANSWGRGTMNVDQARAVVSELGDAPRTDFGYEDNQAAESGMYAQWNMEGTLADGSDAGHGLERGKNATFAQVDGKQALKLSGGESYVSVENGELGTLGLGKDVRVKVKRVDGEVKDQILFESEYGSVKAVQGDTGKVGFTRENFDYSFNYTLPVNEWVELEFRNTFVRNGAAGHGEVSLYVNGELVDTLGDDERVEGRPMTATLMMPISRVGSTSSAFMGFVDDVRIAEASENIPASTMSLDHVVITAEQVLKGEDIPGLRELLDQAYVLFREANPSAEEIESLVSQIEAKLEASKYERADYCRVDAYLKLVQNDVMKSLYDAASLRRLETAVEQVRRDLPKSMQSTVNAYENALVNVLADMNLLPQNNLRVIDAGLLKAEASSAHQGDPAEKVLDGNVNSIWHSDYPNGPTSGDITLTLSVNDKKAPAGTAFDVNGIIVTPRQNGNNGDLKKYKVEVSTDGKNFTEVTTGTASFDGKKPLEIAFDAQTGVKAVRLTWVDRGEGGFASAAEVQLLDANAKPDTEGLNALIAFAEGIGKDGGEHDHDQFTAETWAELTQALAAAKEYVAGTEHDPNEVQACKVVLSEAVCALRLDGETIPSAGELTVVIDDRIPGHEDLVLQVVKGDVLPVLPMPELTGYLFDGWYTDGHSDTWKNKWDYARPVTEDMVLTAKWVKDNSQPVDPNPNPNPNPNPPVGPEGPGSGNENQSGQNKPGTQKPGSGLPQTGDNSALVIGGVGALAVAAIVAGVVIRRRNAR